MTEQRWRWISRVSNAAALTILRVEFLCIACCVAKVKRYDIDSNNRSLIAVKRRAWIPILAHTERIAAAVSVRAV
jgi:hypothetical protein